MYIFFPSLRFDFEKASRLMIEYGDFQMEAAAASFTFVHVMHI